MNCNLFMGIIILISYRSFQTNFQKFFVLLAEVNPSVVAYVTSLEKPLTINAIVFLYWIPRWLQ
jgi:hypothetical protein